MAHDTVRDGRGDFDFYVGTWKVHNRRLKERLVGCTEWEEFEALSVGRQILGGTGNFDTISMQRGSETRYGATMRLYDVNTHEWHLYWADGINGALFAPMIGRFDNGRGEFYAHELFAGRHVYSRFIWSDITAKTCHWEQAYSDDGGKTWETNWTMDSTRVD